MKGCRGMTKAILSFVIPVYNKALYLEECVKSVVSQASNVNELLEIILVNDASTDGSRVLCDSLTQKHSNIHCIHLEKNVGPGMARNVGMKKASGRYVFFLDADDTIESEKLAFVLELLEKTEEVPIVCFTEQLGALGEFDNNRGKSFTVSSEKFLGQNPNILVTSLWNYIFNLVFLKDNNIEFCSTKVCEDYFVVSKVLLSAPYCLCISDSFYNYHKYVPNGAAMSSHYVERYMGARVYSNMLEKTLEEVDSEVLKSVVAEALNTMRLLMFCIPIPLEHDEIVDGLFQQQRKFVERIRQASKAEEKNVFLCPICDLSFQISEIMEIHGTKAKGFADNNILGNKKIDNIDQRVYCVKAIKELEGIRDLAVICHRKYLVDVISKQLKGQGIEYCAIM